VIASALVSYGMEVEKAAITAARTNRLAGKLANLSTATKDREIIEQIPKAIEQCLNEDAGTPQDHIEWRSVVKADG
jgi:NAD(P)H-hydrate repair Nnr-like enzyme with NAD(P)H-hydrate dehydratase domain